GSAWIGSIRRNRSLRVGGRRRLLGLCGAQPDLADAVCRPRAAAQPQFRDRLMIAFFMAAPSLFPLLASGHFATLRIRRNGRRRACRHALPRILRGQHPQSRTTWRAYARAAEEFLAW